MRRLILSFTRFLFLLLVIVIVADASGACYVELDETPDLPNFAHVNEAPRHNSARSAQIELWWRDACPEYFAQDVRGPYDNLVCQLEGTGSDIFVVGAHFDKVKDGYGVADNWSGIVLLKALLQHFSQTKRHLNLAFVAFAGEERGLYGAKAYLRQAKQKPENMVGMLNLDTIGLGELIIDGHSDSTLAYQTRGIADSLNIVGMAKPAEGIRGDWQVFEKAGIPAVGLHSITDKTIRRIHSRQDRPGNVDLELLGEAYLLAKHLIDLQVQIAAKSEGVNVSKN